LKTRPQTIDLLFLAHSLAVGGAERQLVNLARGLHVRGRRVCVAVLRGGRGFEAELQAAGVQVLDLQQGSHPWSPLILIRLITAVRRARPFVLYGYMSLPNVLAVLLRPVLGRTRIVWGVRAAFVDYRGSRFLFRLADALERRLSFLPHLIICNSRAGKEHAVARGYPASRTVVVANGIDTERLKPSPDGRARVRREWKIELEEPLIGIVARFDPMKDHATFLRAAASLAARMPRVKFVCVGEGDAALRARMRQLAAELGIGERVIWAGERRDMPDVYNALDVLCLSSRGEGFPNVIGEAMACGTPCVATDVGDVAWVIGDQGVIVERENPEALAQGLASMLARSAQINGTAARLRIVREFSVSSLCDQVESMLFPPAAEGKACA